jgi:hypothetical protein
MEAMNIRQTREGVNSLWEPGERDCYGFFASGALR